MAEAFTYNANDQYFDLRKVHESEDQNIDRFFDHAEESIPIGLQPTLYEEVVERESFELSDPESDCFFSPLNGTGHDTATVYLKGRLRRSLSTDNLPHDNFRNKSDNLKIRDDQHVEPRASSACSMYLKTSRAPSQESINRLAQPKHRSHDNLAKNEMTMAEAVRKFQAGTPKRFKTRPSPKINKVAPLPWGGTRPHSPKLMTTNRTRKVTAVSKEEQEKKEMEEAKKFRIRAHPVNQKILKGPLKPPIEKKPATVAEPFKLTEIKKKIETETVKVPSFKAQPVPKSLHNPLKVRRNSEYTLRGPSPSIPKKVEPPKKQENPKPVKPTCTHIVPFSFDQRDKQLMKKKEEFINKILEDERKAREFHAKPPPKAILKSRSNSQDAITDHGTVKSSTEDLDTTIFKARPATVLHMKPFEPKRDDNHVLKIEAFQLTTEQRIEARKKFEEKLKEKEDHNNAIRKQQEEIKKILQEQEVAKLRKQMEYKAQPIKKYKEIEIKSANKVTEPKSPKFHTNKLRNKENIQQ